jgi:hypothetical protein
MVTMGLKLACETHDLIFLAITPRVMVHWYKLLSNPFGTSKHVLG